MLVEAAFCSGGLGHILGGFLRLERSAGGRLSGVNTYATIVEVM